MKYNLLALDLDGTLTNSQKKLSDRNKQAIWKAISAGVIVIIASGRPVIGIKPISDELELDKRGGYIMAFNGGKIIDCKTNTNVYENTIPTFVISELVNFLKSTKLTLLTYNNKGIITEGPITKYVHQEAFNNNISIEITDNLVDYLTYPVEKFMAVGEPNNVSKLLPSLQERYKGVLNIFCSEPYFIEIMPLGVEKAIAMDMLLKSLGMKKDELIMCGDGLNDIPLIKYAGLGVAMGNAYDETKIVADLITTSNDDDGVAKVIYDILLV